MAAAGAIVTTFLGNGRAAVVIMGGMLISMILLFIFAKLVSSRDVGVVTAGKLLIWAVTVFFCTFLLFTATAVAVGWPGAWAGILRLTEESPTQRLAEKIDFAVAGPSIDAVNALVGMATISTSAAEREAIVSVLKHKLSYPVTRDYDRVARPIRKTILAGIIRIRHGDVHKDFSNGELKDQDLPGADFTNVEASGVKFVQAFLIGSDFRNAKLKGADLSSTSLRNARFANADLSGASLNDADWFNAEGFTSDQLLHADRSGLMKCPKADDGRYSKQAFIEHADSSYGIAYSNWPGEEQQQAARSWEQYMTPGGLCDAVAKF